MSGRRVGFGTRRRQEALSLELGPLVDIVVATIGVFVIVMALQRIVTETRRSPVPYDALVVCRDAQTLAIHGIGDAPMIVGTEEIAGILADGLVPGPSLLVLVGAACLEPGRNGGTASDSLVMTFDAATLVGAGMDQLSYRYELAPLGAGSDSDESAVVARWRSPAEARP